MVVTAAAGAHRGLMCFQVRARGGLIGEALRAADAAQCRRYPGPVGGVAGMVVVRQGVRALRRRVARFLPRADAVVERSRVIGCGAVSPRPRPVPRRLVPAGVTGRRPFAEDGPVPFAVRGGGTGAGTLGYPVG